MKKVSRKDENSFRKLSEGDAGISEESADTVTEVNSIQEFIELKKLQNRILGKLIEKLNTPENQTKSNNK